VAESALALMLVTGAGLLLHSFVRLSHVDPGLEVDRFVALRVALPESRYADIATQERFARDVLDSLRATAGVEAADLVSHLPFEADFWRYGTIVPERPDHKVPIAFRLVSPGYFETMGIPLQDGRSFTETDRTGSPMVLVLNATAARLMFPGGSAIGGRLDFSFCRAPTCQVVGVVGDVKHLGLDADEEPAMYASVWQKPADWMREMSFLVRAGGEPSGLVDVAKRRIWSVDSALPMLRAETMAQILASTLAPRRFTMTLLAGFALVAALLALVGIQSVVARAVVERRQEIGLRMALGASPGLVVRWMTAEAMTPVLIGLAIGLAGVAGISRILRAELFDLSPYDPATLATACGLMAAAALAASLAPARRAVRIDQVEAMRP
jgi:predicted permease